MRNFCLLVASLVALAGWADSFTSDGFTFETTDANSVAVKKGPMSGDLVIPETVTNQGIDYKVTSVAKSAFSYGNMTSVTFPSTIKTIGSEAFYNCYYLTTVNFAEGLETLGQSAFDGDGSITELKLPSSLKKMTGYCFYGLRSITEINIPEGVEFVGSYNFCGCSSATKIYIPSTVTKFGSGVLTGCNSLEEIIVAPGNTILSTQDGLLYDAGMTTLKMCPVKKTGEIVLPQSLKVTDNYAFKDCAGITKITCPDGYTTMTWASFLNCTGLQEIYLGQSLTCLAREGFMNCSALQSLTLPPTVTTMNDYNIFNGCSSLKELIIPNSVTGQCQDNTFQNCSSLKKLVLSANMTGYGSESFSGLEVLDTLIINAITPPSCDNPGFTQTNYDHVVLVVPNEAMNDYKVTAPWNQFVNIQAAGADKTTRYAAQITAMTSPRCLFFANPMSLVFKVHNEGRETINSLTGTLTIDGQSYPAQTISGLDIPEGAVKEVTLTVPLNAASYQMSINIDQVNGQANESENPRFDFSLEILDVEINDQTPMATFAQFKDFEQIGQWGYNHFNAATLFAPKDLDGYKIIGMKYLGLPESGVDNIKLWWSTSLDQGINGDIIEVVQDGTQVMTKLNAPVEITADGCFFGISLDVTDDQTWWPFKVCAPANQDNGFRMNYTGDSYGDYSRYGTLPMVFYLQGPDTQNSIQIVGASGISATIKGRNFELPYLVNNTAGCPINNFDYVYTLDRQTHTGTVTLDTPLSPYRCQKQEINIPYQAVEMAGTYPVDLKITKINGLDNTLEQTFLTNVSVGDFATTHLSLLEEFTGTGCGFCPRGSLGLNELVKRNPQAVTAAYHTYNSTDPMYLSDRMPFYCFGAPGCQIDRNGKEIDPYYGSNNNPMGIEQDYIEGCQLLSPANLGVGSSWNDNMTELSVTGQINFSFLEADQSYKLSYILTIDSLSHPQENPWKQNNSYAGDSSDDPLIQSICDGSFDVNTYNHVVIDQVTGKNTQTFQSSQTHVNEIYSNTCHFSMDSNSLDDNSWLAREDLSKINVIALLVDNNGLVRNAIECPAGSKTEQPSSIPVTTVGTDLPAIYFNLQGQRIAAPAPGQICIRIQGNQATKLAL